MNFMTVFHDIVESVRREPKVYLWDWSEIEQEGPRLENMVAAAGL